MDIGHFRSVRSGLDMSKRIAFILEMSDPVNYPPEHRAKSILEFNDIFQGRADRSVDGLLDELEQKAGEYYADDVAILRHEAQSFLEQKALLKTPYTKSSTEEYQYRMVDLDSDRPLKIINQSLFDQAAKAGFPFNFFRESYFDQVVINCVPNGTDFNFSHFQNCAFAVCRIQSATFDGARIYDSEFYTTQLDHVTFLNATIAHTHFHDSSLTQVSFQKARLKTCNIIDCELEDVGFQDATLDGCSFGRVKARNTRHLLTATITQGGATEEDCRRNRASILRALAPDRTQAPVRQREAAR